MVTIRVCHFVIINVAEEVQKIVDGLDFLLSVTSFYLPISYRLQRQQRIWEANLDELIQELCGLLQWALQLLLRHFGRPGIKYVLYAVKVSNQL